MTWSERYPADRLVPYDEEWPRRYAEYATSLGHALGEAWTIEHVGSTSVPGLAAKPVIDLAVRVPRGADVVVSAEILTAAGWTAPQELGDHAASFLVAEGGRVAIAHAFTAEQWPTAHVRLFAEWLRAHTADRDRYDALKADLVRRGAWHDGGYTAGKAAFVLEIVNRARGARGLRPVAGPL